jgi:hypothetical protein
MEAPDNEQSAIEIPHLCVGQIRGREKIIGMSAFFESTGVNPANNPENR